MNLIQTLFPPSREPHSDPREVPEGSDCYPCFIAEGTEAWGRKQCAFAGPSGDSEGAMSGSRAGAPSAARGASSMVWLTHVQVDGSLGLARHMLSNRFDNRARVLDPICTFPLTTPLNV